MKRALILIAIILSCARASAQDVTDTTDLDYDDDFVPNFCTWSVALDAETTIGGIGMYNIGVVGGVNFAGSHLFYGAGFTLAYASREEQSHQETMTAAKGADKTITVVDTHGIDKAFLCIAMHLRYHVLPDKKVSPLMQFRIAKALNERSSNYKTAELGISFKTADAQHSWAITGGICRLDYNIDTRQMDSETMAAVNLSFKF